MAQWVKVPAVKSDDLSSILGTNMMMGVKQLLQRICHELYLHVCMCTICAPHVAYDSQERVLDTIHHMSARNQTQVLCKSMALNC